MPNHAHLLLTPNWRWSSVHALLHPAQGDGMTQTAPVLGRVPDFAAVL